MRCHSDWETECGVEAAHQLWRATKTCIDEDRYEGSIQTKHIGETGQPGIGHSLGHHHSTHRDSGNNIHLQQEDKAPSQLGGGSAVQVTVTVILLLSSVIIPSHVNGT